MHIKRYRSGSEGGYALVIGLIFFLAGTTAVIAGISDAVLRETKSVRNEASSRQGYFTSESALEDTIYREKVGKQVPSSNTLSLGSTVASVTVTSNPDGSTNISSLGDSSGTSRVTQATLQGGTYTSFPFALQGGLGGIELTGGSTITGDVYTTGSINGCSSCTITGTATAAGKTSQTLDQDNSSPSTPTQSITFGNSNGTQDLAQSFTVSTTLSITDLNIEIKKVGNPANATIKLVSNSGSSPSSTILASGTLSSSLVSTSYTWMDVPLTANPVLTAGTTYWIVIDASNNASNHYVIAANSGTYAGGQAKIGKFNTSWSATTPAGLDAYFQISIGTLEDGISGTDQYNPIPVTNSYSYKASYVNATGIIYCQVGIENNKACDTSRADPAVQEYPVPDSIIADWKNEAVAGGITNGNVTVGWQGATLGPKKIAGNLQVNSGGTLRISGPLWVTGSVTIEGGSTVMPNDSSKSYALITDSSLTLSGGSLITGNSGSHILLLSTSTNDPAIILEGGANDTVVFIPYGGLKVSGGAHVKAASAKHIFAEGGSVIIYDPDMSQLNFSSGSSGGTFGIKAWKETP